MSDQPLPDQSPSEDASAALAKRKARKPRPPRKRKTKEAASVVATLPTQPDAPAAAPVNEQAKEPPPAEPAANGQAAHDNAERHGATPRKSGRRAWDIHLGHGEHVWERVTTPDDQIVFRFKNEPTEAQMELIGRYNFQYDAKSKEAHRPNDAGGRVYADKLAWYLKELARSQGGHQAAAR